MIRIFEALKSTDSTININKRIKHGEPCFLY